MIKEKKSTVDTLKTTNIDQSELVSKLDKSKNSLEVIIDFLIDQKLLCLF